MNKYLLSQAGIDYEEGLHRFNNKAELYEKFLIRFPEDQSYPQLLAAMESQDVEKAFQAAHALKGVTGNLSIQDLHNALIPLVEELRQGNFDRAPELFKPVQELYSQIVEILESQKPE